MKLAKGVRDRAGVGKDDHGLRYPGDELDPWDQPYDDVLVFDPFDRVLVGLDAFRVPDGSLLPGTGDGR